jgi:hypothetical protein
MVKLSRIGKFLVGAIVASFFAVPAFAVPVDITHVHNGAPVASVPDATLSFGPGLGLSTGDAIVTINATGDFNSSTENFVLTADGGAFSFGTIFNSNTGDDIFNHTTDTGAAYTTPNTAITAIIPLATLNSLLADGQIDFFLDYSIAVDNDVVPFPHTVSIQLVYDEVAVSEPGTLAVFGLGILGLGYMRRRKRT